MRRSTMFLSALWCVGCVALWKPADYFITIRGNVAAVPQTDSCTLELYSDKGHRLESVMVAPQFQRSLGVSPGNHKYYVETSCQQRSGKFRSPISELGSAKNTLDLGTVILQ
jgi:hypothetical protein